MAKLPASLFNDVIGPVMRGPSSSHVAGAARIGALVRQSLGGDVRSVLVEFDVNGSLAESYHGHGSDIGFVSGLLHIDLTDPRVPDACAIAEREGVEVAFSILDYGASHLSLIHIEMCIRDSILPETLDKIAELPHMGFLKEATGDIMRLTRAVDELADRLVIFCGCESLAYESFVMGAQAWVCVLANVAPAQSARLYDLIVNHGKLEEARALYRQILPLLRLTEDVYKRQSPARAVSMPFSMMPCRSSHCSNSGAGRRLSSWRAVAMSWNEFV